MLLSFVQFHFFPRFTVILQWCMKWHTRDIWPAPRSETTDVASLRKNCSTFQSEKLHRPSRYAVTKKFMLGNITTTDIQKSLKEHWYWDQWRILDMAGMARATGATLMGAQNLLGKNHNVWLAVFSTSIFLPIQRLTAQLYRCNALKLFWCNNSDVLRNTKHCYVTTTVRRCDRTRTLASSIYKTSSSRYKKDLASPRFCVSGKRMSVRTCLWRV